MDEGVDKTSKYNEAQLQILRLNNLWQRIEEVVKNQSCDLQSWKFYLDSIWRELFADVNGRKDRELFIQKNDLYKKTISKAKDENQLYKFLNLRHQFLKVLQDKVGKGGAYQDENAEDME